MEGRSPLTPAPATFRCVSRSVSCRRLQPNEKRRRAQGIPFRLADRKKNTEYLRLSGNRCGVRRALLAALVHTERRSLLYLNVERVVSRLACFRLYSCSTISAFLPSTASFAAPRLLHGTCRTCRNHKTKAVIVVVGTPSLSSRCGGSTPAASSSR